MAAISFIRRINSFCVMTTGLLFFVQRFEDHVEVHFVILRKLCIEYRTQQILLYGRKGHLPFGLLLDQFIDHVRIDTCETCSLVFCFRTN